MHMSCVDLLRGLPLPAAPPPADLLRDGPLLDDDGLGLLGVTGTPSEVLQVAVISKKAQVPLHLIVVTKQVFTSISTSVVELCEEVKDEIRHPIDDELTDNLLLRIKLLPLALHLLLCSLKLSFPPPGNSIVSIIAATHGKMAIATRTTIPV
jgi:hypothetical protein